MDSISEIEEVGEINRYLITRGMMDRIKKQVRNMRGNGTAEAQLKKNNKKTQGKQEKIIKKINSQEADVVEMEDQVGVLNRKIKKTKAEIKAEKDGLKDSEEHEMKLKKGEKNNEKQKEKHTEKREAHKKAVEETEADESDEEGEGEDDQNVSDKDSDENSDTDEGDGHDNPLKVDAQKAAQDNNEELNKKSKKRGT